jgi:nucleoid-associated protein YgaU
MQVLPAQFWKVDADLVMPIGTGMRVMYNPTDFTLTKGSQVAEITIPGLTTPLQQFIRGQAEKLTVKLFFDTTDEGMDNRARPVTEETDKFYSLVRIDPELHAPPVCMFMWGDGFPGQNLLPEMTSQKRMWFTGVVESVQQEFTLFSPLGVPLRANLTVTMREYNTLRGQEIELRLESADHTRSHVVQRGETLSGIAGKAYGNPADWRPIARWNGIDNPRRLQPGTILEIPRIERSASR